MQDMTTLLLLFAPFAVITGVVMLLVITIGSQTGR
jgi:hypothetical protein